MTSPFCFLMPILSPTISATPFLKFLTWRTEVTLVERTSNGGALHRRLHRVSFETIAAPEPSPPVLANKPILMYQVEALVKAGRETFCSTQKSSRGLSLFVVGWRQTRRHVIKSCPDTTQNTTTSKNPRGGPANARRALVLTKTGCSKKDNQRK